MRCPDNARISARANKYQKQVAWGCNRMKKSTKIVLNKVLPILALKRTWVALLAIPAVFGIVESDNIHSISDALAAIATVAGAIFGA